MDKTNLDLIGGGIIFLIMGVIAVIFVIFHKQFSYIIFPYIPENNYKHWDSVRFSEKLCRICLLLFGIGWIILGLLFTFYKNIFDSIEAILILFMGMTIALIITIFHKQIAYVVKYHYYKSLGIPWSEKWFRIYVLLSGIVGTIIICFCLFQMLRWIIR